MLARGEDPEEALRYLAYTLTNKLIHQPCTQMRQAGYQGRREILDAAREFLGLPEEDDESN